MMEFVSEVERHASAEELSLEAVRGFGKYGVVMPPEAITHPAKFSVSLVEFLVRRYTKKFAVVLDPFAGTGLLGVVCALNRRHAILIDVEPKCVEIMEKARRNLESQTLDGKCSRMLVLQGDARNLTNIWLDLHLPPVDAVITSPPYSSVDLSGGDPAKRARRLALAGHDVRDFLGGRARNAVLSHYATSPANLARLPYGRMLNDGVADAKRPTYLSEMLKVYRQLHWVLKSGGVAIVVVKPFYRDGRVVDLPHHTHILMTSCGFVLQELYKFRLPSRSLWRIINERKRPEMPRIRHEYILVMRKINTNSSQADIYNHDQA